MTERRGLLDAIADGPVVLDAAIGTRLIARGLDLAHDDPSFWNLTHPDDVLDLHRRDVAAGSDAILTNTFGVSRVGDLAATVRAAVALAREAAGPTRFVLGSIGPGPRVIEAAEMLAEAGVDALVFETFRADQAAEALAEIGPSVGLPRLVSLFDWPETMRGSNPSSFPPYEGGIEGVSGPSRPGPEEIPSNSPLARGIVSWDALSEVSRRLEDLGASVLGVNCVSGMGPALRVVERLSVVTRLPLLVKPSAGLPGEMMETPESFAAAVPALLGANVRLIGGCCGTDERHVAAIRTACYDRSNTRPERIGRGHDPS